MGAGLGSLILTLRASARVAYCCKYGIGFAFKTAYQCCSAIGFGVTSFNILGSFFLTQVWQSQFKSSKMKWVSTHPVLLPITSSNFLSQSQDMVLVLLQLLLSQELEDLCSKLLLKLVLNLLEKLKELFLILIPEMQLRSLFTQVIMYKEQQELAAIYWDLALN